MENTILSGENMPFCPGCGHGPSVKYLSKAFDACGFKPLDVILVSDIGCSGLVDPLFNTHTIHGLHGRSPALAMGVAMGLNDPSKKVVVIQGDGGATIGLQHLLEASRRNIDITLLVLNNLIYGMTGGQVSGLSTTEFKYEKTIPDDTPPFDVCLLAHQAGAAFVSRVNNPKNVSQVIEKALKIPGFSLVEISSLCQPYGAKKMADLTLWSRPETELTNSIKEPNLAPNNTNPLFSSNESLTPSYKSNLKGRIGILVAGSAGGGVQSAAKLLAQAGIISGLSATMKGEYPITVGTGFSVAEVILATDTINYTGLEHPEITIIVTNDGLNKIKTRLGTKADIYVDEAVNIDHGDNVIIADFINRAGKKGAALAAITFWIMRSGIIPLEALKAAVAMNKHSDALLTIIDSMADPILT